MVGGDVSQLFSMVILAPAGSHVVAQPDVASLARVVCTGAFCMGTLAAFVAIISVSISIVRPFLLHFWRHPVADLAALSAASLPLRFWCGLSRLIGLGRMALED